jgi:hypothetical protein
LHKRTKSARAVLRNFALWWALAPAAAGVCNYNLVLVLGPLFQLKTLSEQRFAVEKIYNFDTSCEVCFFFQALRIYFSVSSIIPNQRASANHANMGYVKNARRVSVQACAVWG